jgi:hypothetical protein
MTKAPLSATPLIRRRCGAAPTRTATGSVLGDSAAKPGGDCKEPRVEAIAERAHASENQQPDRGDEQAVLGDVLTVILSNKLPHAV